MFNLTKRQLICFGGAAVFGVPAYFLLRPVIGNGAALFLMVAVMIPAFLLAMYERDGLPFEKVVRNIVRARVIRPAARPYKTENFYGILSDYREKEEKLVRNTKSKRQ